MEGPCAPEYTCETFPDAELHFRNRHNCKPEIDFSADLIS
jgi:hypothetical protein